MDPQIPHRYSRQTLFPGIGPDGQAKLMQSSVAVVGCGALGTVQATLLARAGVGRLRIIDRDFVEESNLQRQVLFDEADARDVTPKAVAAGAKLRAVNSLIKIETFVEDVNPSSAERLLAGVDVIVDGTDNFDARFLVNDFAVKHGIPWVYGACVGSFGLTFPIRPGETACLRCVFASAPPLEMSPTCDTAGVIGPAASVVASLQVTEALKILTGRMDRVSRKIRMMDLWENQRNEVELPPRKEDCPCCGRRDFQYLEGNLGAGAMTLCGRNSVQINPQDGNAVDLDALARRLGPLGQLERNKFLLRARIESYQLTVFADGRAIIGGTYDLALAKSLYSRYVGG
ncbi:MAG TPA: ThiF family adenylyltransferase [Bdellovibrionota bacterium]|nr:ThiF family adenylyltransferase [Bdellovibrionota bacterium]